MPRSMWSGSISFGLVNIPVEAVRGRARAEYTFPYAATIRIMPVSKRKMVCSADGKEVHPEHIVKGYEIAPGSIR